MKKFMTIVASFALIFVGAISLTACGTTTTLELSDDYEALVNETGSTYQLTATTNSKETVTWTSSDTNVATVDETGLVTAVGNGKTTITATVGSTTATCDIMVGTEVDDKDDLVLTTSESTYYYVLTADLTDISTEIVVASNAVIDLNGHTISNGTSDSANALTATTSGFGAAIFNVQAADVEIKNGTINTYGTSASGIYAHPTATKVEASTVAGRELLVENVTISTEVHNLRSYAYTVTLKDCNFSNTGNGSYGMCVNVLWYSDVTIDGGTYLSTGNAVVATNGDSTDAAGCTITISDATINASADDVSSGEIACGIYVARDDTVTISNTTINVEDGLGILQRSGSVTVAADVTITTTNSGDSAISGSIGDRSWTITAGYEWVTNAASNYPGSSELSTTNNTNYTIYEWDQNA